MPRRARERRIPARNDGELALDARRARERRVQRGIDGQRGIDERAAVDENLKERILRAYGSPGHPIAFSGVNTVANFYKISKKRAQEILRENDAYVLHKEFKTPTEYNPYYIYKQRQLVQGDLIDIQKIKEKNDQIQYLFLLIDVFSKKMWVYPLKDKKGKTVLQALRHWLAQIDQPPITLETDQGSEFKNEVVSSFLQAKGIEQQFAIGTCKAAIAERANKSLQYLIFKYLTHTESLRYIDRLQDFVSTYNDRKHRTILMKPNEADLARNERKVRSFHMRRWAKIKRKIPKLKLGDMVRVKTAAKAVHSSRRAYAEQYNGEYFRIVRINRTLPIPLYYLRSMDTGEFIEGGFYPNELSVVRGNVFKIDKILQRRTVRRQRQVLVRWKYFGQTHDEWIPEETLEEIPRG